MRIASLTLHVPVRILINKLDLIPDRIVAGLVGVFWQRSGYG